MPLQDHLPPLNREFVAHFGEMGSRWGINRTVGQIYALIFLSERALNALFWHRRSSLARRRRQDNASACAEVPG